MDQNFYLMDKNFNLYDFAKEVVYALRSVEGQRTLFYEPGYGHVTAEQQKVIENMARQDAWSSKAFDDALVRANEEFANDLLEGGIDRATLPEDERHIFDAIQAVRETGNEELIDSAKEFFRPNLEREITCPDGQFTSGRSDYDDLHYTITTQTLWIGGERKDQAEAIKSALEGDFAGGASGYNRIDHFTSVNGSYNRTQRMAAKAFKAEVKAHLASMAPEAEATRRTGLSAAAAQAAEYDGPA